MQRCQHRRRHLSLLMLDIDHFQTWNDLHGGHLEGDRMLARFRQAAARLDPRLRPRLPLRRRGVPRPFPDTGLEDARTVARRIRLRFERAIVHRAGQP
ncbi:MAG: diguanylate cyclase [bacterium]|nr:diguanylate cyclase [bacterium]